EILAASLHAASLPQGTDDGSGVRVLDVMKARGVPFREVILLGFNQGQVPRRPRQDPFLPDGVRTELRRRGSTVAVKAEARREERLLLAVALAAGSERVTVTWQRADDEGKARAPSLFLREIARLALGRPDLSAFTARDLQDEASKRCLPVMTVSAHPTSAAIAWRHRTR